MSALTRALKHMPVAAGAMPAISGVLLKMEVGYNTQRGVAKGLEVHCLFVITEVSIRCQKNPDVDIRRIPAYTPPQYTTACDATLPRWYGSTEFCPVAGVFVYAVV